MPDPTLQAELLKRATSIGPDKTAEMIDNPDNWKMGLMPLGMPSHVLEEIGREAMQKSPYLGTGQGINTLLEKYGPDWMKHLQQAMEKQREFSNIPGANVVEDPQALKGLQKLKANVRDSLGSYGAGLANRAYESATGHGLLHAPVDLFNAGVNGLSSLFSAVPPDPNAPKVK